jgi:ELWxxDGT repeat protein
MLGHRGTLYFVAATPAEGLELWQSDGTAAGTFLHTDIAPGPTSSEPQDLTVAGNKLYFSAFTEDHGRELWALDLPAAGDVNADGAFTATDDAQRFFAASAAATSPASPSTARSPSSDAPTSTRTSTSTPPTSPTSNACPSRTEQSTPPLSQGGGRGG